MMVADVITKPEDEPISLEIAWAQLRITPEGSPPESPDDAWLTTVGIPGARRAAENFTGRSFARKTYRIMLDAFPEGGIELDMPPVESITSVEYVDVDGNNQTLSGNDYYLDDRHRESWLLPAYGTSWPETLSIANAVTVTYVAGYATTDVPEEAIWGMLLLLSHAFKNREAVTDKEAFEMPLGVEYVLRPLRVRLGMA